MHSVIGRCSGIERRYVEQRKQFDTLATYHEVCAYDEKKSAGLLTAADVVPDRSRFAMQPRPINDPEFEVFWEAYDMNIGREAAHKAWKRLHPSDRERARKRAGEYAAANPSKRFRMSPAKWLIGRHWEDEIIDRSGLSNELFDLPEASMAKPPAFQFYANDFATGCALMTPSEVGCYILMLCHQWDHGFLPNDASALQMLCRSKVPVSANVIKKFTVGEDGNLRNERLERTRADQEDYKERIGGLRRAAANKRWGNANAMQVDMQEHMQNGSTSNASMKVKKKTEEEEGFEEFWKLYAYAKKKPDALRAWVKLSAEDRAACIAIVPAFVKSKPDKKFRPYPATFLNGRMWEDEIVSENAPKETEPSTPVFRKGWNPL